MISVRRVDPTPKCVSVTTIDQMHSAQGITFLSEKQIVNILAIDFLDRPMF